MQSGPSKAAEALVAVFLPPACREEVLGDLHERYRSAAQYGLDAVCTIPFVIVSRIRRTADPQVLLMQVFAWYLSFLGAAWIEDRSLLNDRWGLLRLAVPAGLAVLVLILEDAYAKPGRRSPLQLARGPVLGVGLALAFEWRFQRSHADVAVSNWVTLYGCGFALLLSSGLRMLFPPVTDQLRNIDVPADWLKHPGGTSIQVVKSVAMIGAVIVGAWVADQTAVAKPFIFLVIIVIGYQVWKRV